MECNQIDWNLIFDGLQSIAGIIAVIGGLRFLQNHHKKLKIERRNVALENAFRELIKTDQYMTLFFTDLGVKNDPEFIKRMLDVREKIFKNPKPEFEWLSEMILSYEVFLFNQEKFFYDIMISEKQILVEISLAKDQKLEEAFHEFDRAMAEIFEFMNDFLPDSMFLDPLDQNKVIEYFNIKKVDFPYNLQDKTNRLIGRYLETGEKLKTRLLKHL